jgi:O-antigen/teichoic acid export membrane protein
MPKFNYFSDKSIKDSLGHKTVIGGISSVATQAFLLILHLINLTLLARMLTPEAFGLIAMVTAFTNFAVMFSNMGLSTATIQASSINHKDVSALFWLNVLVGLIIMTTFCLLSDLIVLFYAEPNLKQIVLLLSFGFLFSALGMQHEALLRRHLFLFRINIIYIIANILSMILAVVLAYKGFGYWSLVWMTLSLTFFKMFGMWVVCQWIPSYNFDFKSVCHLFKFGLNITGFNIVNYFSRNLDKVLIGKFVSTAALGEFSRVDQMALFPMRKINGPLSATVLPALSRLQNEPEKYKEFYSNSLKCISYIGTPLVCFGFLMADEITFLVLGPQWTQASLILKCLMPTALCAVTNVSTGWVYNSLGHVNRQFKWGIYASIFLCVSILIGINWGVIGVTLAISISRVIQKVPALLYCYDGTFLKLSDFSKAFVPSLIISILSILMTSILKYIYFDSCIFVLNIFLTFLAFVILYALVFVTFCKSDWLLIFSYLANIRKS